ncbi:MAG TPA: glyoxylate/hydroxypyruvate reductase A [Rhizomicrobium sp.]|nr:glyoxylate/hydroxypyruvate reductase A [Rhizomicrobium sp.]
MTTLLLVVPVAWSPLWAVPLAEFDSSLKLPVHGRDAYAAEDVDYVLSFWPEPGLLVTFPNLKAVFSLGAGVDGFLIDPNYPKHVPLIRFGSQALTNEVAQYVVFHTLLHHRAQREFDEFQKKHEWRQRMPNRRTAETRIGILGLGEIGQLAAQRLRDLGFAVAGWSRTRKNIPGVESFVHDELKAFLARTDILICLLPLTPQTKDILNKETFAALPLGAYVINAARGAHLVEADLIAAINARHIAGASLDVFAQEPLPPDNPLWSQSGVTVTPHVAGLTDPREAARSVINGIARLERGEKLENTVDYAKGY